MFVISVHPDQLAGILFIYRLRDDISQRNGAVGDVLINLRILASIGVPESKVAGVHGDRLQLRVLLELREGIFDDQFL